MYEELFFIKHLYMLACPVKIHLKMHKKDVNVSGNNNVVVAHTEHSKIYVFQQLRFIFNWGNHRKQRILFEKDIKEFLAHQERKTRLEIFRFGKKNISESQQDPYINLEEIYIPVRIKALLPESDLDFKTKNQDWDLVTLFNRLQQDVTYRKMLITGIAGAGKSTFMKYATKLCSEIGHRFVKVVEYDSTNTGKPPQLIEQSFKNHLIPILVPLRDLRAILEKHNSSQWIDDFHLEDLLQYLYPFHQNTPHFYTDLIKKSTCLVLFDGFDEIPEAIHIGAQKNIAFSRSLVAYWLTNRVDILLNSNPNLRFVLTARPTADETILRHFKPFEIQSLRQEEIKIFVSNWYEGYRKALAKDVNALRDIRLKLQKDALIFRLEQLPENQKKFEEQLTNIAVRDLFSNPLLLSLALLVHSIDGSFKIQNTEQLYDKFIRVCLYEWDDLRQMLFWQDLFGQADYERIFEVMHHLAYYFSQQGTTKLAVKDFESVLKQSIKCFQNQLSDVEIHQLVQKLLRLLEDRGNGIFTATSIAPVFEDTIFEFQHKSFQDYLTAVSMHEGSFVQNGQMDLKSKLEVRQNGFWHRTIQFYIHLKNTDFFFGQFIEAFDVQQDLNYLKRFLDYFLSAPDKDATLSPRFADKLMPIFLKNEDPTIILNVGKALFRLNSVNHIHLVIPLLVKIPQNVADAVRIGRAFMLVSDRRLYKQVRKLLQKKLECYDLNKPLSNIELQISLGLSIHAKDLQLIKQVLSKTQDIEMNWFHIHLFSIYLYGVSNLHKPNIFDSLGVQNNLKGAAIRLLSNTLLGFWNLDDLLRKWQEAQIAFQKEVTEEQKAAIQSLKSIVLEVLEKLSIAQIKEYFIDWDAAQDA
jgi:hypothetical protein